MASTAGIAANRLQTIQSHTAPHPRVGDLVVELPRGDKLSATTTTNAKGNFTQLWLNNIHVLNYCMLDGTALAFELSAIGTRYERATDHIRKTNIFELSSPDDLEGQPKGIAIADMWASIYGLFTLHHSEEHIPVRPISVLNAKEVTQYLLSSGLGREAPRHKPTQPATDAIFLSRAAFWQGAGTIGYHGQGWILAAVPVFPSLHAFTRSDMVIASHPLRPPKPRPGEVLYRRYCSAVGRSLEFVAFDVIGNPEIDGGLSKHMAAFHRWHNDKRVNNAWGERGSLEMHRQYVEDLLANPGVVPIMMCWDGELMGYAELVWAKENHVAQYYPADVAVGDWERGLHVLVGDEKFLGGSELWLRSLVHYLFLADSRTDRVVGEPKKSNTVIVKAVQSAGFHIQATIDFPYKRSVLVLNPRERFFSDAHRLH